MTTESSSADNICFRCGEPLIGNETCAACLAPSADFDKSSSSSAEIVLDKSRITFPVSSRWIRIGRDPSNQIVLNDDKYSSRFHAWVTFESEKFWLEDLGSTNGTLLNGGQVEKRELLSSGDKIRIGETDLTFVIHNSN